MKNVLLRVFTCFALLSGCAMVAAQPAPEPKVYTVGITPQFEARRLFEIWRPILDAIEHETGLHFSLRGAPTINEFEEQYSAGQFDFAYVNPYWVGVRNPKAYIPLIRDRGSNLVGVLVVRKDSPVRTVKDLNGKTVAFPARDAVAACLMIRAQLESEYGVRVVPRFVRSHDSTFLNAALGVVDAAGGVKGTLELQPEDVRGSLRELFMTREVAAIPFVANPAVPENVREQVRAAFLKLGATEAGKALLGKVPIKRIGKASMADYEPLRRMHLERYAREQ
jgi:phosphonate transport system substrate-binding protein